MTRTRSPGRKMPHASFSLAPSYVAMLTFSALCRYSGVPCGWRWLFLCWRSHRVAQVNTQSGADTRAQNRRIVQRNLYQLNFYRVISHRTTKTHRTLPEIRKLRLCRMGKRGIARPQKKTATLTDRRFSVLECVWIHPDDFAEAEPDAAPLAEAAPTVAGASAGRGVSPVSAIQPPPSATYKATRLSSRATRAFTSACCTV